MSFNPIQHLLPNQPDNTQRLTPKQKKKREEKKEEISSQVKLSFLKDRLLDLSMVFAINADAYF